MVGGPHGGFPSFASDRSPPNRDEKANNTAKPSHAYKYHKTPACVLSQPSSHAQLPSLLSLSLSPLSTAIHPSSEKTPPHTHTDMYYLHGVLEVFRQSLVTRYDSHVRSRERSFLGTEFFCARIIYLYPPLYSCHYRYDCAHAAAARARETPLLPREQQRQQQPPRGHICSNRVCVRAAAGVAATVCLRRDPSSWKNENKRVV